MNQGNRRKKPERFEDWAYNNGRKRCGLPMHRKGSPKRRRHQVKEDVRAFIDYVKADVEACIDYYQEGTK